MALNLYNLKGGRNKKTQENIFEEIKEKNPNIEIISEYKGGNKNADFQCCNCQHEWSQKVNYLLKTTKCPNCEDYKLNRTKEKIIEDMIEENKNNQSIEVFNKINQKGNKIKCRCKKCGDHFFHLLSNKLSKNGCFKCANAVKRKDPKEYLKEITKKNPYVQLLTKYTDAVTPVKVKCLNEKCGCEWMASPYSLINDNEQKRSGCPSCNQSKGEKKIEKFLKSKNVNYVLQHTYDDCRNIYPLRFDVYLPDYNLCIEYDGEHHYRPVYYSKYKTNTADEQFEYRKNNDKIKNDYCKNNKISLLRIPYWHFNDIEKILRSLIGKKETMMRVERINEILKKEKKKVA